MLLETLSPATHPFSLRKGNQRATQQHIKPRCSPTQSSSSYRYLEVASEAETAYHRSCCLTSDILYETLKPRSRVSEARTHPHRRSEAHHQRSGHRHQAYTHRRSGVKIHTPQYRFSFTDPSTATLDLNPQQKERTSVTSEEADLRTSETTVETDRHSSRPPQKLPSVPNEQHRRSEVKIPTSSTDPAPKLKPEPTGSKSDRPLA